MRVWMISPVGYRELTPPEGLVTVGQSVWLEGVGLGLALWEGSFEEAVSRLWLRWCDLDGQVTPSQPESKVKPLNDNGRKWNSNALTQNSSVRRPSGNALTKNSNGQNA